MNARIRTAGLALMTALLWSACDSIEPDRVLAPAPNHEVSPNARAVALVIARIRQADNAGFQIVSPNGGTLQVGTHSVTIPADAVTVPTLFTLEVKGGDYIWVELRAYDMTTAEPIHQFAKPVHLTLSYADAEYTDLSRLTVVYLPEGPFGVREAVSSFVDPATQTVQADLWHFSDYTMGEN